MYACTYWEGIVVQDFEVPVYFFLLPLDKSQGDIPQFFNFYFLIKLFKFSLLCGAILTKERISAIRLFAACFAAHVQGAATGMPL
jgi:hypothetical protein